MSYPSELSPNKRPLPLNLEDPLPEEKGKFLLGTPVIAFDTQSGFSWGGQDLVYSVIEALWVNKPRQKTAPQMQERLRLDIGEISKNLEEDSTIRMYQEMLKVKNLDVLARDIIFLQFLESTQKKLKRTYAHDQERLERFENQIRFQKDWVEAYQNARLCMFNKKIVKKPVKHKRISVSERPIVHAVGNMLSELRSLCKITQLHEFIKCDFFLKTVWMEAYLYRENHILLVQSLLPALKALKRLITLKRLTMNGRDRQINILIGRFNRSQAIFSRAALKKIRSSLSR